jgi:mycofactocin glycosyltransferase
MELTVVIPTRDRRAILCETLARLAPQTRDVLFEVIVVDDGSADGTADAVRTEALRQPYPLRLIEQRAAGPATARNRALATAQAPVCLFLDDDTWPGPDLASRHRDFHLGRPEREAALLGHIELTAHPAPTRFMLWLVEGHFDFAAIEDPENVDGTHFYTGNTSVKTDFVRMAGGFDECLHPHEDTDLGLRLQAQGMRLTYDPQAVVHHYHPVDLPHEIERMDAIGRSLSRLVARHPEQLAARRPGPRHRLKAAALTACALAGVRTRRLQRETWRFLCHQATREGYWREADGTEQAPAAPGERPRIGRTLARLASRDADARMPPA